MKAREKFRNIFGEITHLRDEISWANGLSNMMEFLLWDTKNILGISKTQYVKKIIEWSTAPEMQGKSQKEIETIVKKKLEVEMALTEQNETYSLRNTGICSPREALRRVKFFSEEYLNKEFDIFLSLASDGYLDKLYSKFCNFDTGNPWSTHGNSDIFAYSVDIRKMQMDNLAYNEKSNILIANELKLNGKKNSDQILKYAYMYEYLKERGFLSNNPKFVLLFISGNQSHYDQEETIQKELEFCQKNMGKYNYLLTDNIVNCAKKLQLSYITWQEIIDFNLEYLNETNPPQVETKLILGFNDTLRSKSFMQ